MVLRWWCFGWGFRWRSTAVAAPKAKGRTEEEPVDQEGEAQAPGEAGKGEIEGELQG